MIINSTSTVKEIQKDFQQKFPGLNVAFYSQSSKVYHAFYKKNEYPLDTSISTISPFLDQIDVVLDENKSVKDFERTLQEQMKLHVQVCRRSTDLWIQTTKTDDWTFDVLKGKGISSQQK